MRIQFLVTGFQAAYDTDIECSLDLRIKFADYSSDGCLALADAQMTLIKCWSKIKNQIIFIIMVDVITKYR